MNRAVVLSMALLATILAPAAIGQVSRGVDDSARLMQQLQQLGSEKTRLQADNDKQKRELDAARKEIDELRAEVASLTRRSSAAEASLTVAKRSGEGSAEALERARAQLAELVQRFRETAGTLREVEAERTDLAQRFAASEQSLQNCARSNVELAGIANEVLTRFEGEGFWSGLARAEPFTQLKRTEIENLVDEYRDQVELQQLPVTTPGAPAHRPE